MPLTELINELNER